MSVVVFDLPQVPDGYEGRAVQFDGDSDWFTFITPEGEDRWLALASTDRVPTSVEFGSAQPDFIAKVCALFGYDWSEIAYAPLTAVWQLRCLRSVKGDVHRAIQRAHVEDLAEWRCEAESVTPAELQTGRIRNEDALALRN